MISSESDAKAYVAERCSAEAMVKLENFVAALIEENSHQNLISRNSVEHIWQRHIADSAQLLDHVPRETSPWLDLGSGPGLPGIVLAIMRPDDKFTLVESRKRRVEFLQAVSARLELANVTIEGARLEGIDTFVAGTITARAFAPLPRLIELSSRFSTADTIWVLPKGRSAEQELAALPKNQRKMFHVEHSRTDPEAKILVGQNVQRKRNRA